MKSFECAVALFSLSLVYSALHAQPYSPLPQQMPPPQIMPPQVIIIPQPQQAQEKPKEEPKKEGESAEKKEAESDEGEEDYEELLDGEELSQLRVSDDNTPDAMISALIFRNPFGSSGQKTPEEITGISLKSAVRVNGEWSFSVASKNGKTVWLKLNETSEVVECKITEFDPETMVAKLLISGKNFDFYVSDKPASPQDKYRDAAKRLAKSRLGGKAIWDYATAEQARQANEIYRLAQQQGRKLSAQERKKLKEIEASIQLPEHLKKGK